MKGFVAVVLIVNCMSFGWSRNVSVNPSTILQTQTEKLTTNNHFLEYYPRQGTPMPKESASFYFLDGKKLVKKSINSNSLRKTVLIFFGDWCPHCDAFLQNFANDVNILKSSGVTVIFVSVPSIERLKNWSDPSVEDFKTAEGKVSSYGIKLDKEKVFVTTIGDKSVLSSCGIEGLPVLVAVKNGKEAFRTVGEKATHVMDLSDQKILKQFLEIWGIQDNVAKSEEKKSEQHIDGKSATAVAGVNKNVSSPNIAKNFGVKSKKLRKIRKDSCGTYKKSVVDREKARDFTEKLNDYDYSRLRVPGLIFY
jgi:thiol-disulfide isomerase/thioredoxin